MKFGLSQIEKETPAIVNIIKKTLQYAAVVVGIFVMYLPIPLVLQAHIALGLLIGNKLISSFCELFGIDENTLTTTPETKVEKEIENIQKVTEEIPQVAPPEVIKPIVKDILTNYGTK